MALRRLLFGRALRSDEAEVEQIGPLTGIPVLGFDALASAAYGPEAALTVLLVLGPAASTLVQPISAGIILVLRTGMQWKHLPHSEVGCSGKTSWRRLGAWQAAGVWAALHRAMLEQLQDAGALDWSRAALDSASLPAKKGAPRRARTRRIGASRARSVTTSWTPEARRSA